MKFTTGSALRMPSLFVIIFIARWRKKNSSPLFSFSFFGSFRFHFSIHTSINQFYFIRAMAVRFSCMGFYMDLHIDRALKWHSFTSSPVHEHWKPNYRKYISLLGSLLLSTSFFPWGLQERWIDERANRKKKLPIFFFCCSLLSFVACSFVPKKQLK